MENNEHKIVERAFNDTKYDSIIKSSLFYNLDDITISNLENLLLKRREYALFILQNKNNKNLKDLLEYYNVLNEYIKKLLNL